MMPGPCMDNELWSLLAPVVPYEHLAQGCNSGLAALFQAAAEDGECRLW